MISGIRIVIIQHCYPLPVYSSSEHIVDAIYFHIWHICWHTSSIDAHALILACGVYMTFEEHICCQHIYGSSMVNSCCILLFILICAIMLDQYVGYSSSALWHICAILQAYLFRGICQIMWNVCIPVFFGNIVDCSEFIWGIYTKIFVSYMHMNWFAYVGFEGI